TDVGDRVEFFQLLDDDLAHEPAGDFGLAQLLQLALHPVGHALDVGGGHGAFCARHADAAYEFVAVELLAVAALFDEHRRRKDRAFVGGETARAVWALAPPPDAAPRIGRGIEHTVARLTGRD